MSIYHYPYPRGYYVYYYLRSKDSLQWHSAKNGSPYYVGRGKSGRAWNVLHGVHLPTDPNNIVVIVDNLSIDQANQIEILHIAIWGRADLGTGILRNRTDGGGGAKGFKHTPEECRKIGERSRGKRLSQETRAKISQANKMRKISAETREKHRLAATGRKHTEETTKKLKEGWKPRLTEASRKAMSLAAKNRKPRIISDMTKLKLKETWAAKKIKRLEENAKLHIPNATDEQIKLYVENALKSKQEKPRKARGRHTQETKDKISKANKGRLPWTTGKSLPQETKDKIGLAHKGKSKGPRTKESIEKGIATKLARYGKGKHT